MHATDDPLTPSPPAPSWAASPLTLLAVLTLLCALPWAWAYDRDAPSPDFFHSWFVSRAVRQGDRPNVYSPEGRRALLDAADKARRSPLAGDRERQAAAMCVKFDTPQHGLYTRSTPFLFTVAGLWGTMDYDLACRLHKAVSLGAFLTGIVLLAGVLGFPFPAALLAGVALTLGSSAFLCDTSLGNVNRLQLGGLAIVLALVGAAAWRLVLAGVLLGLLVLFKPNVLAAAGLLAAVWLIRRRRREAILLSAGGVVGALIALAAARLYFGDWACWGQWLGVFSDVVGGSATVADLNYGLPAVVRETTGLGLSWLFLPGLLAACAAAAWVGRGRAWAPPVPDDEEEIDDSPLRREALLAAALGLAATVLSAQIAWKHYYVLVIPLVLSGLRPWPAGEARGGGAVAWRLATVAALVLMTNLRAFLPEMSPLAQGASWVLAGLAVLAVGLRDLAAGR